MSTVDNFVGRRIRVFRLNSGLTQGELAEQVGITPPQLDAYEDGFARISAVLLFRVANVIGLPLTAFFEGIGRRADWQKEPSALHHYTRQSRLLSQFGALSVEQQDDVLSMVQSLLCASSNAGPGSARARQGMTIG
jgi:transcriptional regulator with XRE-family HTH domain